MHHGIKLGYRGGFLNGQEIHAGLNDIFYQGTVLDPEKQIQQAGIDLTLMRIIKEPFALEISFGSDGWTELKPGRYWAEFNEVPKADERDYTFYLYPRSTHFRNGNALAIGLGKQSGSIDGVMGAAIDVDNKHGLWLQKNTRISQATVESCTKVYLTPHCHSVAWSAPLTVDRIFRFTSSARFGIDERNVEMEEVEYAEVGPGLGSCLVRFAETIHVADNELVTSLADNPYRGLYAMGAVADPGYSGMLHACCSAYDYYVIRRGMPMLQLRKSIITPVEPEDLYDGKYQGTGVDGEDHETVVWYNPINPRSWVQARDMAPSESTQLP